MGKPPTHKSRRCVKINALSQARLILLMLDGIYNCQELSQLTGLHYRTVIEYTKHLHKVGAAHIADWDTDARGRHCIRVFKIGKGRDMKKPKLTQAERQKRYREKRTHVDAPTRRPTAKPIVALYLPNDFARCKGTNDPLCGTCLRKLSEPSASTYSIFSVPPIKNGKCENLITRYS